VVLSDVDASSVFPQVEPFLGAWGGTIEEARVPGRAEPRGAAPLVLAVVALGFLAVALCACAGAAAILVARSLGSF
jgi:hypothetical protein